MQMQTLETKGPWIDRIDSDGAVIRLAPLVAICNQSEQVFAEAIQSSASTEFRVCVGRIRQLLNECGFQLRIEMQRINSGTTGVFDCDIESASDSASCQSVLSNLLENYRRVLSGQIPPHTRAMIRRQYEQLRRLCDELTGFVQALQGLLHDVSA